MSAPERAPLYSAELLALAIGLADYPLADCHPFRAKERSRTCGADVEIGLYADEAGAIARVGLQVSACAVGQAAAAIFARDAIGRDLRSVEMSLEGIEKWLAGDGQLPAWRGFEALAPALPHKGRHGAILLPWRAARSALCKAGAES